METILKNFFKGFNISVNVESISRGSIVETYELKLLSPTLVSKLRALQDNLCMELGMPVRIVAPIPNRKNIGIEIPLRTRKLINFEDLIPALKTSEYDLPIILGEDVYGNPRIEDLAGFPHLLIAGSTGAGKSNLLNSIICSIMCYKYSNDVRLYLVDPKRVEFRIYKNCKHLGYMVTESSQTLKMLQNMIKEMDLRYEIFEGIPIKDFSQLPEGYEQFNRIVIIIDELADLMLSSQAKEIEICLQQIAQLGRAAGIHLVVATQRPTTNILTGKIKTNLNVRIAFKVTQEVDSRTILNSSGAENLLGKGDMLFQKFGLERLHGAYISENIMNEIVDLTRFEYHQSILKCDLI